MAGKKRPAKKKKAQARPENFNQILGAGILVLAILFLVSLMSSNMGIFGRAAQGALGFLFGRGDFAFTLILALAGLLLLINTKRKKRGLASLGLLLLIILTYLDATATRSLPLRARLGGASSQDGGLVGDLIGSVLLKVLGTTGTKIILGLSLVLALAILFTKEEWGAIFASLKRGGDKLISSFRKPRSRSHDKKEDEAPKKRARRPIKKDPEPGPESKASYEEGTRPIQDLEITDYSQTGQAKEDQAVPAKAASLTQEEKETFAKEIEEGPAPASYTHPSLDLLDKPSKRGTISNDAIREKGYIIEETLNNFNIDCQVTAINRGPVITSYEVQPAPGVRLNKIVSLADNLAMSLASSEIRIEAPIPGKSAVGIEVPNDSKDSVSVREVLESPDFKDLDSSVPLALGKDVTGNTIVSSIDKMPHLLIAGATGSGKSVCINVILASILYKSSPQDVKLILIDPKVVELNIYNGIPHLMIPVVTDPKKAAFALNWAVEEMEKRYKKFAQEHVRDLKGYNKKMEEEGQDQEVMAKIVIVVDELSDLMMVAAGEVEDYITRLAQMARAAGIYLIIATQRPSVDVITGTIKANIPSRIAFAVSSQIDSRTILDMGGAEKLLGKGDMLFYPSFYSKPLRVQGAFISDDEVTRVTDFVKGQTGGQEDYDQEAIEAIETKTEVELEDRDELLDEAVHIVVTQEQASISFLQRKLKVGYARAARIVDQLEDLGVIGPHEGTKPRKLAWSQEEIDAYLNKEVDQ